MRTTRLIPFALALVACKSHGGAHGDAAPSAPPAPPPDPAAAVLAAPSLCDPKAPAGAADPLSTMHAWLDGAELPGAPTAPRPKVDDALKQRGAQVYSAHCTGCHGDAGNGQGPMASKLTIAPRDFTKGIYALRTTETQALPTDEDLFRTITRGIHGTAMPPWPGIPEADRWALVEHLKWLSPAFADDTAPPPVTVPAAPTVTPAMITAGRQVFVKAGCTSCHGDAGKGDGPAAVALKDAAGNAIHPRDLTSSAFHRGSAISDIYLTITTGLDGTPMASFAKVLSADDLWAVAAYVHSLAAPYHDAAGGLRCPDTVRANPEELTGIRIAMPTNH